MTSRYVVNGIVPDKLIFAHIEKIDNISTDGYRVVGVVGNKVILSCVGSESTRLTDVTESEFIKLIDSNKIQNFRKYTDYTGKSYYRYNALRFRDIYVDKPLSLFPELSKFDYNFLNRTTKGDLRGIVKLNRPRVILNLIGSAGNNAIISLEYTSSAGSKPISLNSCCREFLDSSDITYADDYFALVKVRVFTFLLVAYKLDEDCDVIIGESTFTRQEKSLVDLIGLKSSNELITRLRNFNLKTMRKLVSL